MARTTKPILSPESDDDTTERSDFILNGSSCWITVGKVSVWIRADGNGGAIIEGYPLHDEMANPLSGTMYVRPVKRRRGTKRKPVYDDRMDPECIPICDAMNLLPGIHTVESCCGHGKSEFRVWFKADSLEVLPPFLYHTVPCHGAKSDWRVTVGTDCAMAPASFCLRGPVGDYAGAAKIAALIQSYLRGEAKP
jgi:hypothetical protein